MHRREFITLVGSAAVAPLSARAHVSRASSDVELSAAFTSLVGQRVAALLVIADPYFDTRRDQIIAFAEQNRLPAMY